MRSASMMLSDCSSVSPRSDVGSGSPGPLDCNRFVDDLVSMMVRADESSNEESSETNLNEAMSRPRQILGARQHEVMPAVNNGHVDQNLMCQLETLPRDQLLGIFRNLLDDSTSSEMASQGSAFGNKENMCYDMHRSNNYNTDAYSTFSIPPPLDPSLPLIGPAEFIPSVPPPMPFNSAHSHINGNSNRQGDPKARNNMFSVPPPPLPIASGFKVDRGSLMIPNRQLMASTMLHNKLEECFGHLRELEKERQMTEVDLARYFPDKALNGLVNSVPVPRLRVNPTRVDRLIVDALKEHSNVFTLLSGMEEVLLKGHSFNAAIAIGLKAWINAICKVQERRQEEMDSFRLRGNTDDSVVLALVESVGDLSTTIRRVRSCLWVAMQIVMEKSTLPFGGKGFTCDQQDQQHLPMDKKIAQHFHFDKALN